MFCNLLNSMKNLFSNFSICSAIHASKFRAAGDTELFFAGCFNEG